MRSATGTMYGADHLPRRTGKGRPGGGPTRPSWAKNDLPTSPIVETYTNSELRDLLALAGVRPGVAADLVADRETAGARWRITQELRLR